MAATAHTGRSASQEDPGGWEAEAGGVPARRSRRIHRRSAAGALSAGSSEFIGSSVGCRVGLRRPLPGGARRSRRRHRFDRLARQDRQGLDGQRQRHRDRAHHGGGPDAVPLHRTTSRGRRTCTRRVRQDLAAAPGARRAPMCRGRTGVKGLSLINVGSGHWQVAFHERAAVPLRGRQEEGPGARAGRRRRVVRRAEERHPGIRHGGHGGHVDDHRRATAAGATTTQPATSTPQRSSSNSSPGANVTTPTQAPAPATMPTPAVTPTTQATQATPTTSPPPPSTTPPTPPPTTTPTTSAGGGGYGY